MPFGFVGCKSFACKEVKVGNRKLRVCVCVCGIRGISKGACAI